MGSGSITVIGGGIAGLASAIALRRSGYTVKVFERSSRPHELGAGITLWANAVAILHRWGIAARLQREGNLIEEGRLTDMRGRQLIHTPVGAISRQFGSFAVGIHRASLLQALLDAVPVDRIVYSAECAGVEESGEVVRCLFADGTSWEGELLVGADGIRSTVFRALHGDVPLRYSGYVCYRGIAPYLGAEIGPGSALEAWGQGRRFGVIRLDAERVYWFANENAAPDDIAREVDLERLRKTFAGWPTPISEVLAGADTGSTFRHAIYDRPYRRDRRGRGRVALVGDAAHPMTPDLGQGACQAIEDAEALAQCLASASDPVAALRAFEELRWKRVSWIVRRSRFQGWVGQHSTRAGCWFRNLLMRMTPARMMCKVFSDLVQVQDFGRTSG